VVDIFDDLTGLKPRVVAGHQGFVGMSGLTRVLLKIVIRVFTIATFVIVAIIFPAFDRIMALMGSLMCITICVILPLLFYLKLFGEEVSRKEKVIDYILIGANSIMAVVGTVWAFMPRDILVE
jgi:vesicular inhibitory amino acid transporter